MKDKKYLIIPANSDLNRGDQALIWETIRVSKESGNNGIYYMIRGEESIKQSEEEGIIGISPILAHPSRVFKNKQNNIYNISLKLKWGSVALYDFITSSLYLNKYTRNLIKKIISKDKKETLEVFQQCESLFVKGGGFLHTYGGIEATYIMYFFLFHIILAQKLGKKVYIMPNSFGPFKGLFVKKFLKNTLSKCEKVYSREEISTRMLKSELDFNVNTYPDLGFFLEKDINEKNMKYIDEINKIKLQGKKCVAITARPYRFPKSENPKEKYIDYIKSFKKMIIWLNDAGYHPIFVEHTLSVCSNENDGTSIREIVDMIDNTKYTIISNEKLNCRDLKGIYSVCDYMIGTRFHSIIFSLSENVPSMAITYGGNKGEGIMNDIGISKYAIPIEDICFENLKETFLNLVKNEKNVKKVLIEYITKANAERNKLINEIK
ncbi:polysaccharide pyruvyl transferase family protein [Clostridium perfringens]|uniref:polysaccharide pyruvyl transferase family protein n=1 Tax=Clostridium perfringens TaxID=1502 RepID=UPI001CCE2FB6|nr:polysaccharide pyruvyl transferase family protein [Clostridium perfringens]UBK75588.1 polysaccharide pyruvyl transferase family protein [Clostridium perfringens]